MQMMIYVAAALVVVHTSAGTPPTIELNENNVAGSMPNLSGNLKRGVGDSTPPPPRRAPAATCTSNDDCQLNGQCTATGACVCDPAWKGESCELLNLLPATIDAGLQDPLLSSWGGSVLQDPVSGAWHMYAAVIENGCGLKAWRPNSAIGHATSTTGSPTGPYTLELPLIKPHFAHEPVALLTSDGTIAIWHIGAGRNDTGPGSNYAAHCANHCTGGGHHWQPGTTFYGPTSILHSTSFDGPWTSIDIMNCSQLPNCEQCGDTNPAPVLHANGSVGMMWRSSGKGWPTSCMLPASAPSWKGPYTFKSSPSDNLFPKWNTTHIEDGHQWIASKGSANPGSYHAIFHSDVEKSCGGAAGGHAWSSDEGATWKFSPRNAFGNKITLVNGTIVTMHQRERPHLVLNHKNQPVALTNGAGWENDCDAVFTFAQPINTGAV